MKSKINNMSFRVWVYFLTLVTTMMIFLWLLQVTFLDSYYRINHERHVLNTINTIQEVLNKEMTPEDHEIAMRSVFLQEYMCGIIYDGSGEVYRRIAVDTMGSNCFVGNLTDTTRIEYMNLIEGSKNETFSFPFTNRYSNQSLSFYGKSISAGNQEMYILVNSPLDLLSSTISILRNQFIIVIAVVFSVATALSIALSRRLSQPIVEISQSARKLAEGNFDIDFHGEGYNEVVELSQTLNYATTEFSKTDELRRDLVANVSHDIKTPLTMIKAYAEMIHDISGDNPPVRNEHLSVIVEEVNHLERLINDMLTLSKYESNVYVINPTEFNLREHVSVTLKLFSAMNVTFVNEVPEDIVVVADEIKMGQVLYNYVNNASRYVGDDNSVFVSAKVSKGVVTVSVTDHGIGMAQSVIDTIWDRYSKINKHHVRNENSTGLGLSIVKAICEANGSEYGVQSTEGEGSTFFYTLTQQPKLQRKSVKKAA